jgi:hypothetical protein
MQPFKPKAKACGRRHCWTYVMSSKPDPWTKTFYHRVIQTKIGQALRAQHDLSQPLPGKMLTLLTELDKRINEGDCDSRSAE